MGVQTICSEPVDTQQDCEVFRPTVVKWLYSDSNIGLAQVWNISQKPYELSAEKDISRLKMLTDNPDRQIPVVIITEPKEKDIQKATSFSANITSLKTDDILSSSADKILINKSKNFSAGEINFGNIIEKSKLNITSDNLKKKRSKEVTKPIATAQKVITKTIDIIKLAHSLASFAHVCFVKQGVFSLLQREYSNDFSCGDIIVIGRDNDVEYYQFKDIKDDLDNARSKLVSDIKKQTAQTFIQIF